MNDALLIIIFIGTASFMYVVGLIVWTPIKKAFERYNKKKKEL